MPFADFMDMLIGELCQLVGLATPSNLQAILSSKPGRKPINMEPERHQGATQRGGGGGGGGSFKCCCYYSRTLELGWSRGSEHILMISAFSYSPAFRLQ